MIQGYLPYFFCHDDQKSIDNTKACVQIKKFIDTDQEPALQKNYFLTDLTRLFFAMIISGTITLARELTTVPDIYFPSFSKQMAECTEVA